MLCAGDGGIVREHTRSVCHIASTLTLRLIPGSLLKLLRLSSSVTGAVSTPAFLRRLSQSLDKSGKAVTKLNLLRITRVVCEHHPDRQTLVERFGLAEIVERLAKQDDAVLVRELAKEITPSLLFGNTGGDKADETNGRPLPSVTGVGRGIGPAGERISSGMRRTTSETVIDIGRDRAAATVSRISGHPAGGGPARSRTALPAEAPSLDGATSGTSGLASTIDHPERLVPPRESYTRGTSSVASPAPARCTSVAPITADRPKHRRQISRSQLR